MYRIMLFLFIVGITPAFAQDTFTPTDMDMEPALEMGTSYAVTTKDSLTKGRIIVFTHGETTIARRVAGVPDERILAIDPRFAIRKDAGWFLKTFEEGKIVFISRDTPVDKENVPFTLAELSPYTKILTVDLDMYESAPSIPHGKFYVRADRAGASDSSESELGLIPWANIIGVIMPSEEE